MARQMKESGISWIGKIPETWSQIRLKYLVNIETGDSDTQDADPDGEYNFYVRSPIIEQSSRYTFSGDSILMAGDGVGAGKVFHYATGKYAVHQRVYCLHDFNPVVNSQFLFLYLSNRFPVRVEQGSAKSTVDSIRLPMLKDFPVLLPSIDEQERIVEFLKEKYYAIDSLASDIQKEIETLEAYKKSLITEAITTGLDKSAPMKDSGILWSEKIPVSWKVSRIKFEVIPLHKRVYPSDQVITCFRDGEVTLRENRREEGFTLSFTENGYQGVDIGDLVIHGMDTFAGAIGCSDSRGKTTPVVHVCKTTGINRFFMYVLRSMASMDVLSSFAEGIRIRSSDFRNFAKLGKFHIAVPPVAEQTEIVDFLDAKCSEIDSITSSKKQQLETLATYKKSLIYEYVTGKKEVI